jgi:hypothetical protein
VEYSDYQVTNVEQPMLELMGTIYNGLFSAGSGKNIADITPSCPTGNCQYPVFQSLALCGSCENATSAIRSNCSEVFDESTVKYFIYCQFQLPNGIQVNATQMSYPIDDKPDPEEAWFYADKIPTIIGTGVDLNSDEISPNGSVLDYTVMKALVQKDRSGISSMSPLDAGILVTADRCMLRFCIKTYESSVTAGQLIEKTLNSWYLGHAEFQDIGNGGANRNITLHPPPANNDIDTTFLIGEWASRSLNRWLREKMTTSNSAAAGHYFGEVPEEPEDRVYSAEMMLLLNTVDSADIFRDLAKTLKTYLRTFGNSQRLPKEHINHILPDNGPVKGTAYELQAYVQTCQQSTQSIRAH